MPRRHFNIVAHQNDPKTKYRFTRPKTIRSPTDTHVHTHGRTDGPTYTRICIGEIVYISGSLVVAVWCLHSLAFSFLIWAPNQFDILLINSFDRLTFFGNYEFAIQTKKMVLSICRWHILAMPSIAKSRHMMILQYLFYCLLSRWLKCCELCTFFWKIRIMQTLK